MVAERKNWLDASGYRVWEDSALLVLGILIGLSPWIAGIEGGALLNASVVGVVIIAASIWQMAARLRWQEVVNVVAGGWLIISPFVFQYAGPLAWWHFAFGALVALLAIHELWLVSRQPEQARS